MRRSPHHPDQAWEYQFQPRVASARLLISQSSFTIQGVPTAPALQQPLRLHEQRNGPVLVVHSDRQLPLDGQPLKIPGLIGMQRHRLLQQQMLARQESLTRQLDGAAPVVWR